MKNKNQNDELDKLIRASMEITDIPASELNDRLKINLYKREAAIRREPSGAPLSLWYVPMVLNFLTFFLFAVLALIMIKNSYISKIIVLLCGYISIAGIVITITGIKRANMKENIRFYIKR